MSKSSKTRAAAGEAVAAEPTSLQSKAHTLASESYLHHEGQVKSLLAAGASTDKLREQKSKTQLADLQPLQAELDAALNKSRRLTEQSGELSVLERDLESASFSWEQDLAALVQTEEKALLHELEKHKAPK